MHHFLPHVIDKLFVCRRNNKQVKGLQVTFRKDQKEFSPEMRVVISLLKCLKVQFWKRGEAFSLSNTTKCFGSK